MRQFEAALKAAGDPTRTRILKLVEDRELCVCQIQAVLGLAPSTVSKHLALLKAAGLVEDRREGRWIHYSLADSGHNPYAADVLRILRGALDREPKIQDDRRRLKEVLRMSLSDLCALIPSESLAARSARPDKRAPAASGRRVEPVRSVLFVCVENSCRSQMAEGFARELGRGEVAAFSAGSRPSGRINDTAVRLMRERGINLTGQASKGLSDLPADTVWDAVVTMGCGDACPHLPARVRHDWELPDPKHLPDEEFRQVRNRIEALVRELIADETGRS